MKNNKIPKDIEIKIEQEANSVYSHEMDLLKHKAFRKGALFMYKIMKDKIDALQLQIDEQAIADEEERLRYSPD